MKVVFLNRPALEPIDGDRWRLFSPFAVSIDGTYYEVPGGFQSDLDSVPRLPFAYWLAKGRARLSAILHDWLYSIKAPRKWADEVLYAAMEAEGVKQPFRSMIYAGVRAGGWYAYSQKDGKPA